VAATAAASPNTLMRNMRKLRIRFAPPTSRIKENIKITNKAHLFKKKVKFIPFFPFAT
jgi:hypothetical protein